MFKQIILVLIFAALFHNIKALTLDDVFQEMIPQLDALKESIAETISEKKVNLDSAHSLIEKSVSDANAEIGVQLGLLNSQLSQAKAQAAANGKNIDSCIQERQLGISKLNRQALNLCKKSDKLNNVGVNIAQLESLDDTVNNGPLSCLEQVGENPEPLRICLKLVASQVDDQINTISNRIDDVIGNAKSDTGACVQNQKSRILSEIKNISNNFNMCVE